eukprot:TRINITY_DN2796_c0_g1_i1.p1 TRINITY_DN2796_c0_g1~~TRINITY_DN2796_c0_g1_i1.p1  ORF type:complete len:246 (+),score=33.83 TRINITY_DN2796_c0_g1_i1:71-808(+)
MSTFDTKVMRWLKAANINGAEKKDVLSNGIEGTDRYLRMETDANYEVSTRNVVDWNCREAMLKEVQKVNEDLDLDPDVNYSEKPSDIFKIMKTLGPNSCGVAWLRHDGTLRLQLAVKKLPFRMVNNMPSPDLPVRVLGLIRLGTLLLEYEPSTFGYDEISAHVGKISQGESKPCPTFESWPHSLREYVKKEIPRSEHTLPYQASRGYRSSPDEDSLLATTGSKWILNTTGRWTNLNSSYNSSPGR